METEGKLRLADVFVPITDPRQRTRTRHDLVEVLVVAVNGVRARADTFVEFEAWANEKLDWFRQYLKLEHGIPSHDTLGRLFGLIRPDEFDAAFGRWVCSVLPALGAEAVVAIDGKTSRRSGKVDATALPLVSAFAAGAGLVMGQTVTAAKSNEITAASSNGAASCSTNSIALINRNNGPTSSLSSTSKLNERFAAKLRSSSAIASAACRLTPNASAAPSVSIGPSRTVSTLHWLMDVTFADDRMRARTGHAAHNLAVLKHITMNLIHLDHTPRKGAIKVRRLIAATTDSYRAHLFGLV